MIFNPDVKTIASNRDTSTMGFITASAIASAINNLAVTKKITQTATMIVQGTPIFIAEVAYWKLVIRD